MSTNAERQLAAEQLDTLKYLSQTMTQWAARWSGRVTNSVLEVGTFTIDATGAKTLSWGAACGAIEVRNLGTHTMTVVSGPATVLPTQGTGMYQIPAGQVETVNVANHTVTVFGTAADSFSYQAYTVGGAPVSGGDFL